MSEFKKLQYSRSADRLFVNTQELRPAKFFSTNPHKSIVDYLSSFEDQMSYFDAEVVRKIGEQIAKLINQGQGMKENEEPELEF